MSIGRDAIYSALWAKLQASSALTTAFKTTTKRLISPAQITAAGLPALSMLPQSEQYEHPILGGPPKVTLSAILRIDAEVELDSQDPAKVINDLVDIVENALEPTPGEGVQTLGIGVQHAWIEGRVTVYPATRASRACLTLIEVKILANGAFP